MDRRTIKVHREPSREECLSAIKMTLIRFNAFVQEMDRQRYYSPGKFTAEHRDFLYEMTDRQYLRNMNAVLTGGQLEELDDEALETVLEKCRRLSDGFGLCVDIPEGARIADGEECHEFETYRKAKDKKGICETVRQHNGGVAKGGFSTFHIWQKVIKNYSKNKLSNSRKQELDKQLENISNKNLTTLVINVPPNKEMSIWEDPVEYHCNVNKMGNVINIKNQYEYDYILRRIPNKILDLVITGAHGNGKKLGKINPIGTKYDACLNLSINIYLPDCYMGSKTLMEGYSKYFGESAIIHARDYATCEQGVAKFVEIVTTRSEQYDSRRIKADFNEYVKGRNQF